MTNPNVCTVGTMPERDPVKVTILHALRAWIHQRPGLDLADYGGGVEGCRAYASELRGITKDLHHARELLQAVERSSITGAELLAAFPRAYSGRLSCAIEADGRARLEYCTGQYWPTEYRKAAAAVAATALWEHVRENMPAPSAWRAESYGTWDGNRVVREHGPLRTNPAAALADVEARGPAAWFMAELYGPKRLHAGDWLRAYFLREFGRGIAKRWFS